MTTTPVPEHPTPQHVVQTYRHALCRIVRAVLRGTEHARWYADHHDENLDSGFAPACVRKGAKRYLQTEGAEVSDEENAETNATDEGQTEFLSNLGLAVTVGDINIRILRSDRGDIPVAGPSKKRRAFYRQETYLPGFEDMFPNATPPPSAETHLVLHWDTDEEYNLTRVYLALPLAGENTRDSVVVLWNEIIWRRQVPQMGGNQVEADVIDQDIYISEQTGTA